MATFTASTGVIDGTINPKWYVNAALETGRSDGDAMSSVAAWASGGAALTQATGTKQPLYKTSIFGAQPAYLFDGVDDFVTSSVTAHDWGTAFLLFKPSTAITTASSIVVPMSIANSSGLAIGWNLGDSTGGFTNEIAVFQNASGARTAWTQAGATLGTVAHILTCRWNSTTGLYDIFHDGGASLSNATTGTPALLNNGALVLGANGAPGQFPYAGYIGVALIYAEVCTDAQKAAVHTYLAQTWGATAADRTDVTTTALNGGGFFAAV